MLARTALLALTVTGTSQALPFGAHERGFREGANHHVGDAGFVAAFHRSPAAGDSEEVRMQTHLRYIRTELASRRATRPELEARRAELLGYLDDYVAKGVTPKNQHLPWRTPVFIDDDGAICAVGYLVERSSGRALPETIARMHRYDLLEDIAAAMPEVRAWIDASGFTLEELASIQPGYVAPFASTWAPWPAIEHPIADGPWAAEDGELSTKGSFRAGRMEGDWTRKDGATLLGSGKFAAGSGKWKSVYPDGKTFAEGRFVANRPDGTWRFYHPSGNLAAEGRFSGIRIGAWRFYYDTPDQTPIAEGAFSGAAIAGEWRHYDPTGKLLATSTEASGSSWPGGSPAYLLDIVPGPDGIHHWVHEGNVNGDPRRLDLVTDGSEPVYLRFQTGELFDADGNRLEKDGDRWTASNCHWSPARRSAAHAYDVVTLGGLVARGAFGSAEGCAAARPIEDRRARHLDAITGSLARVRAVSPEFVRKLALGETTIADAAEGNEIAQKDVENAGDLTRVLASTMTWYAEWPHVDGLFLKVFRTLPGYAVHQP